MTIKKQTLYEILEVSPHASYAEIQAAHERISQKLRAEINDENRGAIEFKLRVLNVAAKTLSTESTRAEYDARLVMDTHSVVVVPQTAALALTPVDNPASMKSDAMLLKADAMSLRADAVSLRADAETLKSSGSQKSPLRMILTVIATFMAIGLVMQVGFSLMALRSAGGSALSANEAAKAAERAYIQNYYQENGVRVNSRAEGEMLDAANRRRENEKREEELAIRKQEEEARKQEADARKFAEESRRMGERVSEELRRAEQQARYEEEQQRMRAEYEKQQREQAERDRIEEERRQTEEARRRLGLN
ncbi:MAG: DnaJ domain-containing protein [Sideroxydans sp.]|nr:DnaJ domain-containing protein [Sideroxydans sp.]